VPRCSPRPATDSARLAGMSSRLWIAGSAVAVSAFAQPDAWASLRFLEGKWQGAARGEPGQGVSTREYRFELNGRFLTARNRSVYEPRTPGAKPEIHEDFAVISYDKGQRKHVLRQFHSEGFVNEYTLGSSPDKDND
jgi:hypothetical protein